MFFGLSGFNCSSATNSETREEVAIKKIGNAFDNRIDAKRTLREIKLLTHMDHENVIKLFTVLKFFELFHDFKTCELYLFSINSNKDRFAILR